MTAKLTDAMQSLLGRPWRLWTAQFTTIVRIELRKNLFTARGFWIYLLAFAPVAIIAGHAVFDRHVNLREDTQVLAGIFQFYYLRLAIFFGCMGIFTRLIRGDMMERSLHYYFLAPVRREVLVIGKWIAGVVAVAFFFGLGVLLSYFFMYIHLGPEGRDFMFRSGAWPVPGAERLIPKLRRLFDFARKNGVSIVSSAELHDSGDPEFSSFPPHCLQGTEGQRKIDDTLLPRPMILENRPIDRNLLDMIRKHQQIIVQKREFDLFSNPVAEKLIRVLPQRAIVCGVTAEHSVRLSCIGLRRLGIKTVLVLPRLPIVVSWPPSPRRSRIAPGARETDGALRVRRPARGSRDRAAP